MEDGYYSMSGVGQTDIKKRHLLVATDEG